MAPKWGKPIDHDPNFISSKGGQDASACQILGYFSHAFWRKSYKPQIWPVSLSQNGIKMRDINSLWPKSNLFWKWSEYINIQISIFHSKRFIETHTYIQQSYTMTVSRCLQTLSTRCKQKCIKFLYSETSESMRILEAVKGLWVLYLAL